MRKNKHIGSTLDEFLKEEGVVEAFEARASAEVAAWLKGASAGRYRECSRHETKAQDVNDMALTRDFKQTVAERVKRDPAFARALLDEAATLKGELHTARLIQRGLVNAGRQDSVSPLRFARETVSDPE